MMRRFIRFIPLILFAVLCVSGTRIIIPNRSQSVAVTAVPLNPDNPAQRDVGGLRFLGAWHLQSDNSDFGGFSALGRLPDGRFLTISDAGWMAGFRLSPQGRGRISDSFIARLPGAEGIGPDGADLTFEDRDAEGLTTDGAHYWISYEANHAVRRFGADFIRVDAAARPKGMQDWPDNGGGEAIVRLSDGRFLIFAETADNGDGATKVLLFTVDPTDRTTQVSALSLRAPDGYRVTEAAQLPDGDLLLLNRRLGVPDGFTAKLTRIRLSDIRPDAILRGTELATLSPPLTVDNMEGMMVETGIVDGKVATILWLMSDDNYFGFQRTILMQFMMKDARPAKAPAPGFQSR